MTAATARVRALSRDLPIERRWAVPASLCVLIGLSLLLRTAQLGAGFWIDEGISVGVAHHHWSSIPHVLRQDGSPPAYYMLLGLWIRIFGDSEDATHALSLVFALACIPAAYLAGRSIFDRRTGMIAALLTAFTPYLTYYGQETRMYALEALLSLLAVVAWVNGILRGHRWWAVALVPTLSLLVYAHNWGLFFCIALAIATAIYAREHIRTFALVAAAVVLLYLPWLPTFVTQVRHTGAPWSTKPSFHELLTAAGAVIGGDAAFLAFIVTAAAALAYSAGRIERALAVLLGSTVLLAWLSSQVSPAWTTRYFGIVLGPVVVLAAAAVARAGRVGAVALVAVLFLWWGFNVRDEKENARQLSAGLAPLVHPGELVISTHPEQVPVLRYYLGGGLRWATTLGPVTDPQVFDWRDAVDRLRAAQPRPTFDAVLGSVPKGSEVVVVAPLFRDYRAWKSRWTRLVWRRSLAWTGLLQHDPRFELERHLAPDEIAIKRNYFKPLQAFVYRRVS